MTANDAKTWIQSGGYAYRNAWPPHDCIIWSGGDSKYYWGDGSTKIGEYVPSTIDDNSPDWAHSGDHTDNPPR